MKPPIFEADVLDEKEASIYNTTDQNTTIFSFPSDELLQYIFNLERHQEIVFTLKIGGLDFGLVLSDIKGDFAPGPNKAKQHKFVSMRGTVRDVPNSKASITISTSSFYATIVARCREFSISNTELNGKSMPNIFSLIERQYVQSTKKDKNHENPENNVLCENISINLGLQVDELFVDHYVNHPNPLESAKDFARSVIDVKVQDIWSDIDDRFVINYIWVEGPAPNDLYDTNPDSWDQKIRNYWNSFGPCIRRDGIVYFSGHEAAYRGVVRTTFKFACEDDERGRRIAIITKSQNNYELVPTGWTTAHEFGHLLGLGHEDLVCDQPCQSSPDLLMCPSYGESAQLSTCMRGRLNALTSDVNSKCKCLAEEILPYTNQNIDCPRCDVKITNFTNDNPNPIINCSLKSDIMNFSATIKGGCNAASYPIRAKIPIKGFAQVVRDQNNRFSDYFTHVNVNPLTGVIELIARKYPDSLPGNINPELVVDFPNPDTIKNINFKLRFTPDCTLLPDNYVISVYMGNSMQEFGIREVAVYPYYPRTVLPGQTVLDVIQKYTNARFFQINRDLDFQDYTPPLPFPSNGYLYELPLPGNSSGVTGYNFTNFHFIMGAGNKFHLNTDTKLKIINGSIEGCETMWAGIELEDGASIECVSSELKDAQWAIKLKGSAIADVRQTTFENNNYGFQALVPTNVVPPGITLSGNKFITTGILKAPYVGQAPLPFGGRGYAGVYVDRVPALNISSSGGMNSQFKNLHNGIITYNSNLRVSHTFFEDILKVSGAPSLPGTIASPGKAIYARNGSLVVKGEGILAASPATFTNCHTAVEGLQTTLSVTENKMLSVNNGVSSRIGVNKKVFISTNDIQAKDLGIGVFHALALPNGCQVNENTVRMIGNAQGVGIKTGGSGDFEQQEGLFSQNTIIVTDGAAGIDVGVSRNLKVSNNLVTLNNGSTTYGIGISGGDLNGVNCNTINGVGQKGIYGIMAGRSNFVCNNASGTGIGLNFEGVFVGKGSIRVAGNTMNNNAGGGLLMGSDAVIGEQVHQGNKWTGTGFTLAQDLGGLGLALKSLFTVDANENPFFLPNVVIPALWFVNNSTPSNSYQCAPNNPDCPIVQFGPDPIREKEIATSQLTGMTHQAPQLWTAQRRLYERLSEEGNPYANDVDISNFLVQSQTNGLKAYADMQIGIRQIFQTSAADRSDLASYETQIAQGLDQLAQMEVYLSLPDLSQQDSISLTAQRNAIQQTLANLNTLRNSKLSNLASARISTANTLHTQNYSMNGTGDYRINEKMVNAIYLETIALGSVEFSSSQLASLQTIAAQCPLSGGEAVLRARDILALVPDAPIFYNDATNCGIGFRASEARNLEIIDKDFVNINPNPASESAQIQYSFVSKTVGKRLLLFNLFGQIVSDIPLVDQNGEALLPTYTLPSGMYHFIVTNSQVKGNLVITH